MRRGRGLRWLGWGVVALTAVMAVALASRFGSDPAVAPSPLLGQEAPAVTLPLLDEPGEVSLTDLRGEIVVVNFFASWCLECRLEHGALVAAADAFADAGVRFLAVSFQDDPADSMRFLDELGWSTNTVYLRDVRSRAAIAFGVFGVPETYFIDPEGVVVGRIVGPTDALTLGAAIDSIRRGEGFGQQVLGRTRSAP